MTYGHCRSGQLGLMLQGTGYAFSLIFQSAGLHGEVNNNKYMLASFVSLLMLADQLLRPFISGSMFFSASTVRCQQPFNSLCLKLKT